MTRLFSAAVAVLAVAALPALAQTPKTTTSQNPSQNPAEVTNPSGQNSGTGISSQPGNKGGPTEQPPSSGSSTPRAGTNEPQNPSVREQDSAKVPGLPGNKSGPAVKPPSNGKSK